MARFFINRPIFAAVLSIVVTLIVWLVGYLIGYAMLLYGLEPTLSPSAAAREAVEPDRRLVLPHVPGFHADQRGDHLEVVLDPVVDLLDRGVLRHQQPVPAAKLRHVAQQHHGPVDPAAVEQRDEIGHSGARPHLLEVEAWIAGGALEIRLAYSAAVHAEATMRAPPARLPSIASRIASIRR